MSSWTFDCWRTHGAGQLTLVAAGMANATVVIDRDSGNSVTLGPAEVRGSVGVQSVTSAPTHRAKAWWGDLP
jgi:hypothetical protein